MSTTAIIANWQFLVGMLIVSITIGAVTIACMARNPQPRIVTARRIIAVAMIVPALIILVGLAFAMPMDAPRRPESRVGDTFCMALLVVQLVTLTFTSIVCAQRANGPTPMRAAGAVSGCVLLGVLTLLSALGAGQALAGASL